MWQRMKQLKTCVKWALLNSQPFFLRMFVVTSVLLQYNFSMEAVHFSCNLLKSSQFINGIIFVMGRHCNIFHTFTRNVQSSIVPLWRWKWAWRRRNSCFVVQCHTSKVIWADQTESCLGSWWVVWSGLRHLGGERSHGWYTRPSWLLAPRAETDRWRRWCHPPDSGQLRQWYGDLGWADLKQRFLKYYCGLVLLVLYLLFGELLH